MPGGGVAVGWVEAGWGRRVRLLDRVVVVAVGVVRSRAGGGAVAVSPGRVWERGVAVGGDTRERRLSSPARGSRVRPMLAVGRGRIT